MANHIDFKIEKRKIDKSFYDDITVVFSKYGFQEANSIGKGDDLNLYLYEYKSENTPKKISWPPDGVLMQKGNFFHVSFLLSGKDDDYGILLRLHFSDTMTLNSFGLSSSIHVFTKGPYDEIDRDLYTRLAELSHELHKKLNSSYTEGQDDHNDFPWLKINDEEIEIFIDLYSYSQRNLHNFRTWLKNPDIKIDPNRANNYPQANDIKSNLPIQFDSKHKEYHLLFTENGVSKIALLRYELTYGGGVFPKSTRDNLFFRPTEEEIERFQKIAWRSFDIKEVHAVLGDPDIILPPVTYIQEYSTDPKNITAQSCYTQLSPNAVVIFRQYEDGLIIVQYAGKEKVGLH